jgi:hypothetical protein
MEITIEMPMIDACDVAECTYNRNAACHAKAITIGDGVTPGCDTYMSGSRHVKNAERRAGVGACKVSGCQYNNDFECGAGSVSVGLRSDGVFCMTYSAG